jgi:hypothetical protein
MLARLKRASRRCGALVWVMAVVFAAAPVISTAHGAPVGTFSRPLIHAHAHAHGDEGHIHRGHGRHHYGHHHHHDHDGHHHHDDAADDGTDDPAQDRLHVHYDASCPSVAIAAPMASLLHRVADRVVIAPVEAKQGAPPDRLLRPPISAV